MLDWVPLSEPHRLPAVCGLYLIRHRESGKEYVGKSVNVRSRAYDHRRARTGVTYLYRAIRKHGIEAFDICLLATGAEAEMTALEVTMIAARGTFNPAGYNQTHGGDGISGYRATPEHRAAIVARQTGRPITEEAKAKMRESRLVNNPFKGRKHTPETLAKISEASRNREHTLSPEGRAALVASNSRKKGTKTRPHTEEARQRISDAKRGVPRPDVAERFQGTGNPMHGRRGADHPGSRPVLVWVPNSMTPVTFESVTAAAQWAGCRPGDISSWCSGRYRPKNKFVWCSV